MLTHIVASQAYRLNCKPSTATQHKDSADSRVEKFLKLSPLKFLSTQTDENPQKFVHETQMALRLMHATEIEAVEISSYRFKIVAFFCYEIWKESNGGIHRGIH